MKIVDLSHTENFAALSIPCPEREINGVYIGDLLSWVMGRAQADSAWITIMSNTNIVAVASLTDVSCIILTEGVRPDEEVLKLANDKGVNILATALSSFDTVRLLISMGL